MSKPKDFYWGVLARMLNKLKEWATRNKFSCEHQPLINIKLENVVLDELHLICLLQVYNTSALITFFFFADYYL